MFKVIAVGNLGKDCVVNVSNGKQVINFNVAYTEKYKDRNGTQTQKTTWLECSWWTDSTTIAQYLKKGVQVLIEGKPEARGYQKNDGSHGVSFAVRIQTVQLLGGNKKEGDVNTGAEYNSGNTNTTDINGEPIDDLPF